MTVNELFEKIHKDFENSEFLQNFRVVEDLVSYNLGISWSELKLSRAKLLSDEMIMKIWTQVSRLSHGEPLAYITGTQFFYEDDFFTDFRALIPRTETEILVESALDAVAKPKYVLDLGTGTGCIGLTLAKKWPDSKVYLVDASAQALELCEKNRKKLNIENTTLVHCQVGEEPNESLDSLTAVDIIVANPPYIEMTDNRVAKSVRDYEPHQALFAQQEGKYWLFRWLNWTYPRLKKGGVYLFEFGRDQEKELMAAVASSPFSEVKLFNDHTGHPRFFSLKK